MPPIIFSSLRGRRKCAPGNEFFIGHHRLSFGERIRENEVFIEQDKVSIFSGFNFSLRLKLVENSGIGGK